MVNRNEVPITHVDQTIFYATDTDDEDQTVVVNILKRAWCCEIVEYPKLSTIDAYAVKNLRIVANLEIKRRNTKWPEVHIDEAKVRALEHARLAHSSSEHTCVSIFVAQYPDGIYWINIDTIEHRFVDVEYGRTGRHRVLTFPCSKMKQVNLLAPPA